MQDPAGDSPYLVAGELDHRDVFTLNSQMRGQRQYVLTKTPEEYIADLCDRGAYQNGVWGPLTYVCNLNLEKKSAHVLPHLIVDLDWNKEGGEPLRPHEVSWVALTAELSEAVKGAMVDPPREELEVLIMGGQWEDKQNQWSLHVHFYQVTYREIPPKELMEAINELPWVKRLKVGADRSIYTNGIRFGLSGKGAVRRDYPHMIYDSVQGIRDPVNLALCTFPLHSPGEGLIFAEWKQQRPKKRTRNTRQGDGEVEHLDQAIKIYRQHMDRRAKVSRVQADGRIDWRDNLATNNCKHASNNHYSYVINHRATWFLDVYCGGPEKKQPRRFELFPAPMPMEEEDSDDGLEDGSLLQWLITSEDDFNVGTPFLKRDFVNLNQEAPPYAVDVTSGGLCINVDTFNDLRDAGCSARVLARYVNLGLTLVHSHNGYMVRNGQGLVLPAREQFVGTMLKPFRYQGSDDKKAKPFFDTYKEQASRAFFGKVCHYRAGEDLSETELNLLIYKRTPPLPLTAEMEASEEFKAATLFFDLLLHCLCHGCKTPPGINGDVRARLVVFLRLWAVEIAFGWRLPGVAINLIEPNGGVGKSMFINILRGILGSHQVHHIVNMKAYLQEGFNSHYAAVRLFAVDDADWGGSSGNAFKSAITAEEITTNIKYGANGVTQKFAGGFAVLANRPLDDFETKTATNRRHAHLVPMAAYPELIEKLSPEDKAFCLRTFGTTHKSWLKWGHTNLASSSPIPTVYQQLLSNHLFTGWKQYDNIPNTMREMVEGGLLQTHNYISNLVSRCGPVGTFIMKRLLEHGCFIDTDPKIFTWPSAQMIPDNLWICNTDTMEGPSGDMISINYDPNTMMLLYNADARVADRYTNTTRFVQEFCRAFNMFTKAVDSSLTGAEYSRNRKRTFYSYHLEADNSVAGNKLALVYDIEIANTYRRCIHLDFTAFNRYADGDHS